MIMRQNSQESPTHIDNPSKWYHTSKNAASKTKTLFNLECLVASFHVRQLCVSQISELPDVLFS